MRRVSRRVRTAGYGGLDEIATRQAFPRDRRSFGAVRPKARHETGVPEGTDRGLRRARRNCDAPSFPSGSKKLEPGLPTAGRPRAESASGAQCTPSSSTSNTSVALKRSPPPGGARATNGWPPACRERVRCSMHPEQFHLEHERRVRTSPQAADVGQTHRLPPAGQPGSRPRTPSIAPRSSVARPGPYFAAGRGCWPNA